MIRQIFSAIYRLAIIHSGIFPKSIKEEILTEAKRRKAICDTCALRTGKFCDSKKVVIAIYEKANFPYYEDPTEKILVSGCGCFLPLKRLSKQPEGVTDNLCPLHKW